jgi:hypothetical protein
MIRRESAYFVGAEGLSFVGSEGERAGAPGWNGALVGAPNFAFMLIVKNLQDACD